MQRHRQVSLGNSIVSVDVALGTVYTTGRTLEEIRNPYTVVDALASVMPAVYRDARFMEVSNRENISTLNARIAMLERSLQDRNQLIADLQHQLDDADLRIVALENELTE